ncbi:iron-siderophore ABC transporter substrate-binding protein [Rhodococcoides fascians]|jgi:iron complex transport system substrate-binding protein|uniref:iron-siderophore ABC transporter substrate-binding protein n=1 Tax=Rhodococcoides fascians TaxID=1828 RepID=UPI00055BDBDF|nr:MULTISPECIES: iron-siderophore ABC transporter substrate-binding protein [Rhodococcus]OZE98140.1 iron ABC transporter substrate-binding protein [Rhodococcus sp. 15-1189-1-1a]OZF12790.1 iron ABC transporter substrate-binding protein [Rhodococcus sp. 14-2686-1-2]
MIIASRRRAAALSGLVATALVLAGCGSTEPAESDTSGDFAAVTIDSALGQAVITEKPERIVTLGMGSAETAIALGTVPVGVEEYPWGSDDSGYLPWIDEALDDDRLPQQFTGGTELNIEAILALDPDLILAPWSGITQQQFDALNGFAPVVAYEEQPWTITWEDQISVIGKAMGEQERAAEEIDKIKSQFADATASHPEYEDVSFSYIYNTGPGTLGVFLAEEQRVAMVRALGLEVDPVVYTLDETEGTDSAVIGLENANLLNDSDLIFTFYSDAQNRSDTEAQPAYNQIPAVNRGSVVAPTEQPFVTGSSIINPLTVPWALERYVPMIDEAIAKLPARG